MFPLIHAVYGRQHQFLVEHNLDLLEQFCRYLGSGVRIVRATRLEHGGTREERLLDLVRNAGGDGHLTSTTTTHVIDWTGFEEAGIPVYHQLFDHPAYPQGPDRSPRTLPPPTCSSTPGPWHGNCWTPAAAANCAPARNRHHEPPRNGRNQTRQPARRDSLPGTPATDTGRTSPDRYGHAVTA
ncbi:conserved hypothetical protein [Arthrobacter sp. Hiyo8]|nr:conserved hypothetical protein [Arthrobacter sp. Hiyo8]